MTVLLVLTAQALPAGEEALKARCEQLIAYYDRYGASRSAHSDGRRNHTRLGAEIDCENRLYAEGIAAMETLLRNKRFKVPPPATDEIDIDE
ncbi:MAG: hypothetical protein KIS73_28770 [Enhydrobacter sp.]|nr:hypothetical protein [Enhydrobacter sp.]